ncbi:MAG: efflux RND transporter permease subunit, partial [Chlamydiia bacterium]|nr:efflux RND transporter permease subunit [Chlamydiia bacterium]
MEGRVDSERDFEPGFFTRFADRFLSGYAASILILIAASLGVAALCLTPQEEEPQIIVPFADVFVSFPGASAQEVENLVALPLERLLWQIDGVEYVYSMSQADRAIVSVRFYVGEDRERSLVKLYNKINSNSDLVPPGVAGWVVKPVEIDDVPIVNLTLHSPRYDDHALYRIAEELRVRLDAVSDLSRSTIVGGRPLQTRVDLKVEALEARGVSPLEVSAALKAANSAAHSGVYDGGNRRYELRSGPFLSGEEDVSDLVVGVFEQRPVYLRDIAQIETGAAEPTSYSRVSFGGASEHFGEEAQTSVTLAVAKKKGTNGVLVAKEVLQRVDALKASLLPDDVYLTVTRNTGETAEEKVSSLLNSLFLAIVIVVALLFLFLGWRAGLVVALSIPVTFSLALFTNYLFGFTINRVTLFALILTLGLVVDDPITAIDNIWRHI